MQLAGGDLVGPDGVRFIMEERMSPTKRTTAGGSSIRLRSMAWIWAAGPAITNPGLFAPVVVFGIRAPEQRFMRGDDVLTYG
jgi:hypothetical protein